MQSGLYLFSELSEQDVLWLAAVGSRETVDDGDVVIEQGKFSEHLMVVLAGMLSVSVDGIGEINRVGTGEVLGEVSFVDTHPPSATVTAVGAATYLAVPMSELRDKLASDRGFAVRFYRAIAQFLAARLRSITEHYAVAFDVQAERQPEMQRQAHARFEQLAGEVMGA